MQLKDKTAIVTGGANGIGRETTLKFVSEGCRVMIWDVDADKAAETQKMAGDQSSMIDFMSVDIRSYEAVEEAVAKTVESLGKIDILINNAGVTADSTLKKMTPDQWQKVIDVNLTGVFNC
ncbi:MAG TPA: SDR family NAD(P)-dependent oxidoreductase, partial [Cryomorphaceae bacterium]|nr:SDR family NAD(P)-dependent oxidoreductase [Cryomorphaceae bacterium]